MKKIILITSLLITSLVIGQETLNQDFNRWSIEVAGGLHKPARPLAAGYYTATPSFGQFSLGTRYMFNNLIGAKLDLGYYSLKNDDNSLPFKSTYLRASLQGVVNVGSLLQFQSWTSSIGLLAHGGAGYSRLSAKEPIDRDKTDQMLNMIVGLTPQLKLSERIVLTGDVSLIGNTRQDYTWDGTGSSKKRGFDGYMMDFSVGLTFYLGKNEKHADWVSSSNMNDETLADHEARLAKIETDMIDSDQDGVADYLDREPNTPSGVTVDTKGRAIDKNNNGIPDELESSLDKLYVKKGEEVASSGGSKGSVKDLLDDGYVNVYFQFNSDKPENYSLEAINYLSKYMKENPSASAELIGYADEIGNADYNQKLSERRAKRVYDILIATGVSANRLSYAGGGQDTSVDKSSSPARQLVRRVTFKLK